LIVAPDKGAKARALRGGFGQQSELRRRLLKHAVAKNEIRQTDDALAEIASYRRIAGLAAGVPAVPVSGDRRRGNTSAKVIGHVGRVRAGNCPDRHRRHQESTHRHNPHRTLSELGAIIAC
jgi:hypothetical protein